jgi:predicted RNA binding protein YcfA (HicA-like mRNA interferase family)
MPPKIRELIAELERSGFTNRDGKGSHRNFSHLKCSQPVRISSKTSDDAKFYQIKQVRDALGEVRRKMRKKLTFIKKLFIGVTKTIVLLECVLN